MHSISMSRILPKGTQAIWLSDCLSVCRAVRLAVCLSVYLPIHPYVCLSVRASVSVGLPLSIARRGEGSNAYSESANERVFFSDADVVYFHSIIIKYNITQNKII